MATFSPDGLITALDPGEVFVFGSNLAGRHGAGAAKQALKWGALYGRGRGLCGQTYALPTKDQNLRVLPPERIALEIRALAAFAVVRPTLRFYLTAIGTGLAGLDEPLVRSWVEAAAMPSNVSPWWKWAMEEANV